MCPPQLYFSWIKYKTLKTIGIKWIYHLLDYFFFLCKFRQRVADTAWLQPTDHSLPGCLPKPACSLIWWCSLLRAVWSALQICCNPVFPFQLEAVQAWPGSCEIPRSPGLPGAGKLDAADTEWGACRECTEGSLPLFLPTFWGHKETGLGEKLRILFWDYFLLF